MKRRHLSFALSSVLALALFTTNSGCGSSGGNSPDGGGLGGASGSGTFRWKDNGTQHTAAFASGARVSSTMLDMVQVTGSDSTGAAVSFAVSLMPPPLVPGAYACSDNTAGTGRVVSISYVVGNASGLAPTCAITLTTVGATTGSHATGTFSATLPFDDGTMRTITDGVYDVSLVVSSI